MLLWRRSKRSSFIKVVIIAAVLCVTVGVACSPRPEDDSIKVPGDSTSFVPTIPPAGDVDRTDLDACITDAVLRENAGKYRNAELATEAHTVLKTEESGETITVYAMALYLEFDFASDGPVEAGGSHAPVAITFKRDADGKLEIKEFWWPQNGTGYAPSIKAKFPADIHEDALDTQKYILQHFQACYAKAVKYARAVIDGLLETICSSPSGASSPQSYINEHDAEYRKLLYYGDYTLKYVFSEFLQGGQTGLEGHIMLAVLRELIAGEDVSFEAETPQEWFDDWKDRAVRMLEANSMEYMAEHAPKAFILLQMLER